MNIIKTCFFYTFLYSLSLNTAQIQQVIQKTPLLANIKNKEEVQKKIQDALNEYLASSNKSSSTSQKFKTAFIVTTSLLGTGALALLLVSLKHINKKVMAPTQKLLQKLAQDITAAAKLGDKNLLKEIIAKSAGGIKELTNIIKNNFPPGSEEQKRLVALTQDPNKFIEENFMGLMNDENFIIKLAEFSGEIAIPKAKEFLSDKIKQGYEEVIKPAGNFIGKKGKQGYETIKSIGNAGLDIGKKGVGIVATQAARPFKYGYENVGKPVKNFISKKVSSLGDRIGNLFFSKPLI